MNMLKLLYDILKYLPWKKRGKLWYFIQECKKCGTVEENIIILIGDKGG